MKEAEDAKRRTTMKKGRKEKREKRKRRGRKNVKRSENIK